MYLTCAVKCLLGQRYSCLNDLRPIGKQSTNYETTASNIPERNEIVAFCKQELEKRHARKDYAEILELTIIFLGDIPRKGVHFVKPGAMHRARWMSRVLYAIKMVLFQCQFKMTRTELIGL